MNILVFPHAKVSGEAPPVSPLPAIDAFTKDFPTDAHAVAYLLPNDSPCKRLRLGDLQQYIDDDNEPLLHWIFVDVDNPNHQRWTPEEAEAHALDLEGPDELDTATFYSTRGGYRLVWRLSQPIPCSKAGSFIAQFYDHLESHGIPLDRACVPQWNTLFRLPRVVRDGAQLDAFVDMSPEVLEWTPPLPLTREVRAPGGFAYSGKAPPLLPLNEIDWAPLEGLGGVVEAKLPGLKLGKLDARKGTREDTVFKIISKITGCLEAEDPAIPYQYVAHAVVTLEQSGSHVTLGGVWDKCCRIVGMDTARRAAEEKVRAEVREGQPPIVYAGKSFYIRDTAEETYRGPVFAIGIHQMLDEYYHIPGLERKTERKAQKSAPVLLEDYGRLADVIIYEMGLDKGYFDNGQLIMGCAPMLKVKPRYSSDVAKWLELFAGSSIDKLLDWLATVQDINNPTCALYIDGPPSTGKGLFAAGVAALWGTGATSYQDAVGKFNSALMRNPIVHADEHMSLFDKGSAFSAHFRSLIGESERQLRIKNQPSATLRGCCRLIIGANNADALNISENLSKNDLDAIAQRILYVQQTTDAADYLRRNGGREFTKNWVRDSTGRPGHIAAHIAHLHQTRKISRGARFLVEGEMSEFHRDLIGKSGIQGLILQALAQYFARAQWTDGVWIEERAVFVNADTLHRDWPDLTGEFRPKMATLRKGLKSLSIGGTVRRRAPTSTKQKRYWKLAAEDVHRASINLQIGDPDRMDDLLINGVEVEYDRAH